jgi:hypothetical protein
MASNSSAGSSSPDGTMSKKFNVATSQVKSVTAPQITATANSSSRSATLDRLNQPRGIRGREAYSPHRSEQLAHERNDASIRDFDESTHRHAKQQRRQIQRSIQLVGESSKYHCPQQPRRGQE